MISLSVVFCLPGVRNRAGWGKAWAATRDGERSNHGRKNCEKGTNAQRDVVCLIRSNRAYNDTDEIFRPGRRLPGEALRMVGWFSRRLRRDREDGAALVEFALVLPLLMVLLLGMIDAGWAFSAHLEVRHGAREGARLAAVSSAPSYDSAAEIIAETCSRMNTNSPDVTVTLALPDGVSDTGDSAAVTVSRDHSALTGFIPFFDNITLASTVEIRLEQPATTTWAPGPLSGTCGP